MEDYENAQRPQQASPAEKSKDVIRDPVVLEIDTIKSCYTMLRNLETPARVRVWRYLAELLPVND